MGSVAKWHLEAILPNDCLVRNIIEILFSATNLGLGGWVILGPVGRCGAGCSWEVWAGGWGWVLLGPMGRRSPGTAQNPGCSWELWGWGMGLGAPGLDGQALPGTAQNPARLVYGSAALVGSLRGQQSNFATLPKTEYYGSGGRVPRSGTCCRISRPRPDRGIRQHG